MWRLSINTMVIIGTFTRTECVIGLSDLTDLKVQKLIYNDKFVSNQVAKTFKILSVKNVFIFTQSNSCYFYTISVQSLSHVQLFATPWTAARQASLSITNSLSLLKIMSIESVIPSSHLILCHPLLPFNLSQHQGQFFTSVGQSIRASSSASIVPINVQD